MAASNQQRRPYFIGSRAPGVQFNRHPMTVTRFRLEAIGQAESESTDLGIQAGGR